MNLACLAAIALLGLPATGGTPPTFSTDPANSYQINQSGSNSFTAVAESFTPTATATLGEIDLPLE
jgi:hypothetical protein